MISVTNTWHIGCTCLINWGELLPKANCKMWNASD